MDDDIKKTFQKLNESMNGYTDVISETLDKLSDIGKILCKNIGIFEIPNFNISPDVFLNLNYMMTMHKLNYPLFLESDKVFKNKVVNCKDNATMIEEVIYEYVNEEYLNNMLEQWKVSECIKKERLPIFKEAIELHLKGYYYACTTMMMCQLYGVVIDIYNYIESNDVEISLESKSYLAKEYSIEKIDSEKGKLIQLAFVPDGGNVIKEVIVEYFKKEILSSSESKKRWEHQPLRNKICHGDQLNYGTKEHSLKSILCINLLIKLGESIKGVIESIQEDPKIE